LVALSAKALNTVINMAHENRLTRQQFVMFCLADMMASVEVAAALTRKAKALMDSSGTESEKIRAMARIFASETAQTVAQNAMKIVMGSGIFDDEAVSNFMESISHSYLVRCYPGLIKDMDLVADILFER
jgi:alkylation response protein AidB-like acyl-CoA dehydrogenase